MSRFTHLSAPTLILLILLVMQSASAFAGDLNYRSGDPEHPYIPEVGSIAPSASNYYHSLSGTWHLQKENEENFQVDVPGCWPTGVGQVTLSTTFRIPSEYEGRYLYLVFWGAKRHISVKVNGRLVEAWDADWPNFVVELPKWLLRFDQLNDLQIEIDDELSARHTIPLKPKLYDPVPYAGIFSDVALVAGPTVGVEDLEWDVSFRDQFKTAEWSLDFTVRNHSNSKIDSIDVRQITVYAQWVGPEGLTRGRSETVSLSLGLSELVRATVSGRIDSPKLWSVDSPNLYKFNLVLQEKDSTWSIPLRFGLNEIVWEPDGILLNGQRTQVRGIDLRQETVSRGIALTTEEVRSDLEKIKGLGFNLVRIIGDPPHPATSEICDELGLLLVPQLGLRGVPEAIFLYGPFKDRLERMLISMVRRENIHPSVAGWGIMNWAPPTDVVVGEMESLQKKIVELSNHPLIAGFAINGSRDLPEGIVGIAERPPYDLFEPLPPMRARTQPWLVGGLGGFATRHVLHEDSVRGQVRQSDALLHQLKAARSTPTAGFILDAYADRLSALPMLITGAEHYNFEVSRGLLTRDRDKRIAWQKVGDAMGQLRIEAPTLEVTGSDFPIIFPLATMAVGGFLLLMMRQNNVFRHNLQRVFAHTHGFFVDIRDKRYFQSGQTFLVALLFSAGQAIIAAAWLHHSRTDFGLDYLITLLLPFFQVKAKLVEWAWEPLKGIAAFTLINFIVLLVIAFIVRIVSIPFRGSLSMKQSFSLVSWASTNYLMLIPLGLVFYRFLDFGWFLPVVLVLYVLITVWFLVRVVSMVRIGYRVTNRGAWLILILMLALISGTVLVLYRSGFAMPEYLEFYSRVISPWSQG